MSDPDELEQALRNLPRIGTVVKDRGYRQVWRFEHGGRAYYLKFYPKAGPRDAFRRVFRGSPAMMEFTRLQRVQQAGVAAPRAVAALMGFRVGDRVGDAVILEAIEPAVPLDAYLHGYEMRGESAPDHRDLAKQVRDLVEQLGKAKLGHEDLHLGNFLLKAGKLYLLDGYAVRLTGLQSSDLMMLGHSARRFATLTDLQRGWDQLGSGGFLPRRNTVSPGLWRRFLHGIGGSNRYFGKLAFGGGWSVNFFKQTKLPYRWSSASRLTVSADDWRAAWPALLRRVEADDLPVLKRSRSGDVLAATVTVGGRPVDVVVKRPRRRYWYRYVNEVGRGPRAWRAWGKAWDLVGRGLPTAWPLMVARKRVAGYAVDALIVCEHVPGATMAHVDLDAIAVADRETVFRRAGRTLREIERGGYSHFDAKASNWVVRPDPVTGPTPVLVDVDGVRRRRWIGLGIERLLRSLHENAGYAPPDSLALCRGYAPFARLALEPAPNPDAGVAAPAAAGGGGG